MSFAVHAWLDSDVALLAVFPANLHTRDAAVAGVSPTLIAHPQQCMCSLDTLKLELYEQHRKVMGSRANNARVTLLRRSVMCAAVAQLP
jgi:hypothetical protein